MGVGCGFKLKDIIDVATRNNTLSHHGECNSHCHTFDFLDSVKRPEALRKIAGAEVARGYSVAVATQTIGAEQTWQEAGGRFFCRQDAYNAGASYKSASPDSRSTIIEIKLINSIYDLSYKLPADPRPPVVVLSSLHSFGSGFTTLLCHERPLTRGAGAT